MLIVGIVVAIARYVSETAVIRMVDEYEGSGNKMTVRQGFRIGWSRTAWRLFLINLIVNLPVIALVLVLLIAGIGHLFFSGQWKCELCGVQRGVGDRAGIHYHIRGRDPDHPAAPVAQLLLADLRAGECRRT